MSLPRYESYKHSGVAWLGEVPKHWSELPLKMLASHNDDTLNEDTDPDLEILYVDISSVDPAVGIITKEAMSFSTAPSRARRRVQDGDVIVSTVRTYLRAIARVTQPEHNLVVSTGFAVVRASSRMFDGFLGYLLSADFFVDEVISKSVGVSYPAVNASDLMRIIVPLPVFAEQQAIALFLDRETGKIDALIAEQRRLIDLLKEKRQAVISHAVTRGLNPEAPMKDSGVEWLGEVPAHWAVSRLKAAITEPLKYGANETSDIDEPAYPRFVRITDVNSSGFLRDDTFRSLPPDVAHPYLLKPGDVLLARSGATVGKSFVYRDAWGACCFAGYMIRARLDPGKLSADFFYDYCQSVFYWAYVDATTIKATIQNVSAEKYASLYLPLPPLAEQQAIALFLDRETARIDTLVREAESAIALLQERRAALISAAVTGKIDVRGLVELPAQAEAA